MGSYWLGIDVGSTFTAAAVCRDEGTRWGAPEVVGLGSHSAVISSVVYLGEGGQVVVGEAAQRRALTDPDRVVRGFIQRIGDEVPMVIGGVAYPAPRIAAMVIRWVVTLVAAREGGPAAGIVLTHPAGWGAYKRQIMAEALCAEDLPEIMFRSAPEAAAICCELREDLTPGSTLAVYDLGGETCDATVVRKNQDGTFSVLGHRQEREHRGGADFDDAVFGHVTSAVPALADLHPEDPATLAAFATVRRQCTAAKEALSADTEVTIPVLAPGIQSQVRLVRAEFEDLIRLQVEETVQVLRRALGSAQLEPAEVDVVLLVGGSCRVPLVAQLVSARLERPVAIGADPQTAIALGAARSASPSTTRRDVASDPPVEQKLAGSSVASLAPAQAPRRPVLTAIPLTIEPEPKRRRVASRRVQRVALAGSLALLAAAAAAPLLISRSTPTPQATALPGPGTSQPVITLPATTATTPATDIAREGEIPAHTALRRAKGPDSTVPAGNLAPGGPAPSRASTSGGATATLGNSGSTPTPGNDGATATPNVSPPDAGGETTPATAGVAPPSAPGSTTATVPSGDTPTTPGTSTAPTTSGDTTTTPSGGNLPPSYGGGAGTTPAGGNSPPVSSGGTTSPSGGNAGTTTSEPATPSASDHPAAPSGPPAKAA